MDKRFDHQLRLASGRSGRDGERPDHSQRQPVRIRDGGDTTIDGYGDQTVEVGGTAIGAIIGGSWAGS